jgi:Flp pilus assembly protein TadD
MTQNSQTALVRRGLTALDHDNTLIALLHFQEAAARQPTPTILSCLGYCLAREQGELHQALTLCQGAIRDEPANPLHYLNLGRVYRLSGQKHLAILAFRKGLKFGRHQGIIDEMKRMGVRRPPVFLRLGRKHPINRFCGILLNRLGLI